MPFLPSSGPAERIVYPAAFDAVEHDAAPFSVTFRRSLKLATAPVEGLHLIAQHDAFDPHIFRKAQFEHVSLVLPRDRASDHEPGHMVVIARTQDEHRATPALLVSSPAPLWSVAPLRVLRPDS